MNILLENAKTESNSTLYIAELRQAVSSIFLEVSDDFATQIIRKQLLSSIDDILSHYNNNDVSIKHVQPFDILLHYKLRVQTNSLFSINEKKRISFYILRYFAQIMLKFHQIFAKYENTKSENGEGNEDSSLSSSSSSLLRRPTEECEVTLQVFLRFISSFSDTLTHFLSSIFYYFKQKENDVTSSPSLFDFNDKNFNNDNINDDNKNSLNEEKLIKEEIKCEQVVEVFSNLFIGLTGIISSPVCQQECTTSAGLLLSQIIDLLSDAVLSSNQNEENRNKSKEYLVLELLSNFFPKSFEESSLLSFLQSSNDKKENEKRLNFVEEVMWKSANNDKKNNFSNFADYFQQFNEKAKLSIYRGLSIAVRSSVLTLPFSSLSSSLLNGDDNNNNNDNNENEKKEVGSLIVSVIPGEILKLCESTSVPTLRLLAFQSLRSILSKIHSSIDCFIESLEDQNSSSVSPLSSLSFFLFSISSQSFFGLLKKVITVIWMNWEYHFEPVIDQVFLFISIIPCY